MPRKAMQGKCMETLVEERGINIFPGEGDT
jgi:hypothetical protein